MSLKSRQSDLFSIANALHNQRPNRPHGASAWLSMRGQWQHSLVQPTFDH